MHASQRRHDGRATREKHGRDENVGEEAEANVDAVCEAT